MNNEQSTKSKCPRCGEPAHPAKTTETCLMVPEGDSTGEKSLACYCVNPGAFHAFSVQGEGVDPCCTCEHNAVTHDPGTFIRMKQVGERQWTEIHECPNCHTSYEVLTN